jgi:hypothetical protein
MLQRRHVRARKRQPKPTIRPVNPPASLEIETWASAEIISALEECVGLLAPTGGTIVSPRTGND